MKNNTASGNIPSHLKFVIEKAKELLKPSQIILFGSRARGDARENSDFDLAFKGATKEGWVLFKESVEETAPSLYNYDLVLFGEAPASLKEKINSEGIVLYERKD